MYGAQTDMVQNFSGIKFENDVEMYGAQTHMHFLAYHLQFENDVEMYGAQTGFSAPERSAGLRMM